MVIEKEYRVLDHGFIRIVDLMGSDESIVNAARVSYGSGTSAKRNTEGLIRYLVRHRHTSPLEMCELIVHVKAPIFVVRQWFRHRTASVNEYSARYSIMDNDFYYPAFDEMGKQSTLNKQGRESCFTQDEYEKIIIKMKEVCNAAYNTYQDLLEQNVAREIARSILPVNIYTQFYWKIDAHNLMHFLKLRCDSHAQYEIREYALILKQILKEWLPITHKAFEDYIINSRTYSAHEQEIINKALNEDIFNQEIAKNQNLSQREINELKVMLEL